MENSKRETPSILVNEKEIVKSLLKEIGWSQARLAEEAGFKRTTNVSGLLNDSTSGMRVDRLFTLLDAMGFEIVIRDKRNTKREWKIEKQTATSKEA